MIDNYTIPLLATLLPIVIGVVWLIFGLVQSGLIWWILVPAAIIVTVYYIAKHHQKHVVTHNTPIEIQESMSRRRLVIAKERK